MNMNYMTDPNEVEALVDAIKAFFADAADHERVDVGEAVELLTATVRLVDPDYTPPEPDEVPDITARCSCCDGVIAVCDVSDEGYVWYHYSPSTCDDPEPIPGSVLVNGEPPKPDEETP